MKNWSCYNAQAEHRIHDYIRAVQRYLREEERIAHCCGFLWSFLLGVWVCAINEATVSWELLSWSVASALTTTHETKFLPQRNCLIMSICQRVAPVQRFVYRADFTYDSIILRAFQGIGASGIYSIVFTSAFEVVPLKYLGILSGLLGQFIFHLQYSGLYLEE